MRVIEHHSLIRSEGDGTPLDWETDRGNGIVDQLISHAAKRSIPIDDFIDAPHPHLGRTLLQIAIQSNREETAKKLMAAGALPLRRGKGATVFYWALSYNRFSIFKFILSKVLRKFLLRHSSVIAFECSLPR